MGYDELITTRSPEGQIYWEGLLQEKLLIQKCLDCDKLRHYPRPMCDACYSFSYGWIQSKCRGTILSWVVSHHPFHLAFKEKVPYTTITADLEEGIRLLAPLMSDIPETNLSIGKSLKVGFTKISPDFSHPHFELTSD